MNHKGIRIKCSEFYIYIYIYPHPALEKSRKVSDQSFNPMNPWLPPNLPTYKLFVIIITTILILFCNEYSFSTFSFFSACYWKVSPLKTDAHITLPDFKTLPQADINERKVWMYLNIADWWESRTFDHGSAAKASWSQKCKPKIKIKTYDTLLTCTLIGIYELLIYFNLYTTHHYCCA